VKLREVIVMDVRSEKRVGNVFGKRQSNHRLLKVGYHHYFEKSYQVSPHRLKGSVRWRGWKNLPFTMWLFNQVINDGTPANAIGASHKGYFASFLRGQGPAQLYKRLVFPAHP
jgi:hypothetical protein